MVRRRNTSRNLRFSRIGAGFDANVRESYPSRYAPASPYRRDARVDPLSIADTEPRAINCAQCNAHIPDYGKLSKCWHCETDNFLGRRFSLRRL